MSGENLPPGDPFTPRGAVFLSYAREDAAAARRIADALRAFGVEVWFDQHELRGGDVWDQKIRKQIKECALFVPIVSAVTEGRAEGYFRREWKMAVERTADMGRRSAFLVPVVIDATAETEADVPEEFLRVQWTRLPNGVPSPEFVAQVKRLLEAPRRQGEAGRSRPAQPALAGGAAADPAAARPAATRPFRSSIVGATVLFALLALGGWRWLRRPAAESKSDQQHEVAATSVQTPSTAAAQGAKSIAVLPFENLSTERENEIFASGMHDDVITALTKIHGLKVISRTSVMLYKPGGRNLKQIASELGVTSILEGSVQRSGQRVKVNVQLIDAGTDQHLWAETYTEELSEFFALQSKLATAITAALQVQLSPEEKSLLRRRETTNPEAYALYQRARELIQRERGQVDRAEYEKALSLLGEAVRQDKTFLPAFVLLSRTHGLMNWFGYLDPSAARRAAARQALEAAQQIGPKEPQTRLAAGIYYYLCENDWPRAIVELRAAQAGLPNDADVHSFLALAQRRLGRWHEALASSVLAVALDPHDPSNPSFHTSLLLALRRYDEALEVARRYVARFPDASALRRHLIEAELQLTGDKQKYLAALENVEEGGDLTGAFRRYRVALLRRDYATATQLVEQPGFPGVPDMQGVTIEPVALQRSYLAFLRGEREAARAPADEAVAIYERGTWTTRQEPWAKIGLATANALAGRTETALRLAGEATALQAKYDQWSVAAMRVTLARLYGILGQPEQVLGCLRDIMTNPGYHTPNNARLDPMWDCVRADPRFEQILKLARPQ